MRAAVYLLLCLWPCLGAAEAGSLFAADRGPLVPRGNGAVEQASGPSLFSTGATGLFGTASRFDRPAVAHLRELIGQAESPQAGYDAVQHGARIKPAKPPTQMTLAEIFAWIDATPGQPHAIGRYQFIPDTLRRVVAHVGARPTDRFSPALQDRLADVLLADAGFDAFLAGELDQGVFMNNLAAIWAGLPTSTGRSRYHGVADNRATITLAHFQAEISKIRPADPS